MEGVSEGKASTILKDREEEKISVAIDGVCDHDGGETKHKHNSPVFPSTSDDDSRAQSEGTEQDPSQTANYHCESASISLAVLDSLKTEHESIRNQQRELQKKLKMNDSTDGKDNDNDNDDGKGNDNDNGSNGDGDNGVKYFDTARERNNEIFNKVQLVSEAVVDADNLNLISHIALKNLDKESQSPRYDATRIVEILKKKLVSPKGKFNWTKLGKEANVCFHCIPSYSAFLSGPLNKSRKNKRSMKKRVKCPNGNIGDDIEVEKPEVIVGHTERGVDHLSAHERNVEQALKIIKTESDLGYKNNKLLLQQTMKGSCDDDGNEGRLSEKASKRLKKSKGVCAVNLMFNPSSFTQTVENMFNVSYLVKKGDVQMSVREKDLKHDGVVLANAGPRCTFVKQQQYPQKHPLRLQPEAKEGQNSNNKKARQSIVVMNMKDWRSMIGAYGVEQSYMPHRTSDMKHEQAPPTAKPCGTNKQG